MSNHEGIKNPRFNRYVQNNTDTNGYPPEFFKTPIRLPMDVAILLLKRFEEENYVWLVDNKKVALNDLITHLCWAWGAKQELEINGNIFESFFPGLVKSRKKTPKVKTNTKIKKPKNTLEKRGRKPKIQASLFSNKLEHTNPGEAAAENN